VEMTEVMVSQMVLQLKGCYKIQYHAGACFRVLIRVWEVGCGFGEVGCGGARAAARARARAAHPTPAARRPAAPPPAARRGGVACVSARDRAGRAAGGGAGGGRGRGPTPGGRAAPTARAPGGSWSAPVPPKVFPREHLLKLERYRED